MIIEGLIINCSIAAIVRGMMFVKVVTAAGGEGGGE